MTGEFPPYLPKKEFAIGQKVKLKDSSKVQLAHIDLQININDVLTISEYHVNNDDDNGDTVIVTDENGVVSGHIAVWHLEKVLN